MKKTAATSVLTLAASLSLGACSFTGTKSADGTASSPSASSTSPMTSTTDSPASSPTSDSPTSSSPSASQSTSSSPPPLAGGMPTVLKDGDVFVEGVVSAETTAVEQHECGEETKFYVKDHSLYSCDEQPGNINRFHLVRPCTELMAEDKKAVGDGARQETWTQSGTLRELFTALPDKRLRYLVTLVQTINTGKTVARGSALLPYTHKDGDRVNLSFPMWVTPKADRRAPQDDQMTVCFNS